MWNFTLSLRSASRMSSCFFSSRLKTRISPKSLRRKRLRTALPKEPVPPVMRRTLSLNRVVFSDIEMFRAPISAEFPHARYQLRPRRGAVAGGVTKAGRVERSVDRHLLIRDDFDGLVVLASHHLQQAVLVDRLGRDVIQAVQCSLRQQEVLDDPSQLDRRQARENGLGVPANTALLRQKPVDQAVRSAQLVSDDGSA